MSDKKELTYILGAGASFESIPVVKTFGERFNKFAVYLKDCCKTESGIRILKPDEREKFLLVADEVEDLYLAFKTHQSFDTYFKKLFHRNDLESIKRSKKILNIYFTWEHSYDAMEKEYATSEFKKESSIDKRYDGLIAGLLKPIQGVAEPFYPINFISWNYDVNLLLSLKNFFQPDSTLLEFITEDIKRVNDFEWKIGNKISIVNMNGFFFSKDFFSKLHNAESGDCFKTIKNRINANFLNEEVDDSDAMEIKFAWETNNKVGEIALEKIKSSENIIIIGYTFPLYNRLIDNKYFNFETTRGKNIYVQDLKSKDVTSTISDAFNIKSLQSTYMGDSPTSVKEITNCDYFFIPNNMIID